MTFTSLPLVFTGGLLLLPKSGLFHLRVVLSDNATLPNPSYESERRTRKKRIDPKLKALGWKIIPFDESADLAPIIPPCDQRIPHGPRVGRLRLGHQRPISRREAPLGTLIFII